MSCNDCNDYSGALCSETAFRAAMMRILCGILAALETTSSTAPITNVLEQVVKTDDDIQTDYLNFRTIGLLNSAKKLNYIRVVNSSDCGLDFSYDSGTTVAFTVLANTIYTEDLNMNFTSLSAIQMRRVTGESAGFGDVLIEGRYNT